MGRYKQKLPSMWILIMASTQSNSTQKTPYQLDYHIPIIIDPIGLAAWKCYF